MNDLEKYFAENTDRGISKWSHYFEIYDRHFSRFRGTDVSILEFGVWNGGSLRMWRDYFGKDAKIYAVDINPYCKQFEEEGIEVFIGDQEDRKFLKSLAAQIPKIDILLDDGGHTMWQQIATYEELFPFVDKNGVYLCEDLHTSYWKQWGGGVGKSGTFINYSKNFIDYLHAFHSVQKNKLDVSEFTRTVHSLHYYDSILAIEKRPIEKPSVMRSGTFEELPAMPEKSLSSRVKTKLGKLINRRKKSRL